MPTLKCPACGGLGLVRAESPAGGVIDGGASCPQCKGVGLIFEVPDQVEEAKVVQRHRPAAGRKPDAGSQPETGLDLGDVRDLLKKLMDRGATASKGSASAATKAAANTATRTATRRAAKTSARSRRSSSFARILFAIFGAVLGDRFLNGNAGMDLVHELPHDAALWVFRNRDWLGAAGGGVAGYVLQPILGFILLPLIVIVAVAAVLMLVGEGF